MGIAPSNRPLVNQPYEIVRSIEKEYKWYSFDIGIYSFLLDKPPIENLYEDLIKENEGDALVNIRYFNEKGIFGFISRHRFGIKADLVRLNGGSSNPNLKKRLTQ